MDPIRTYLTDGTLPPNPKEAEKVFHLIRGDSSQAILRPTSFTVHDLGRGKKDIGGTT